MSTAALPHGADVPLAFRRDLKPGTWRLFADFTHGDGVRTAAFTVEIAAHEEAHG